MKIVYNNIIPFDGYKAITIWPFIFVRKGVELNEVDINHEEIHGKQQVEMLVIPFFVWYLLEWAVKLVFGKGNAYHRISFEREAFENEKDMNYLEKRRAFAWLYSVINS